MDEDEKLLMSDSLRGQIPDLEQLDSQDDYFVIFALVARSKFTAEIIIGTLVGISVEPDIVKVEMRIETSKAYDFLTAHMSTGWECLEYHLQTASKDYTETGPFRISSPRMMDFDKSDKHCTLGFDLLKVDNN